MERIWGKGWLTGSTLISTVKTYGENFTEKNFTLQHSIQCLSSARSTVTTPVLQIVW